MRQSRHYQQRIRQRGIKEAVVELLLQFGFRDDDEIVLTKDACKLISESLAKIKRNLDKIAEKGGYKLIVRGNNLITAYRLNSYMEGKAHMGKKRQFRKNDRYLQDNIDESLELENC